MFRDKFKIKSLHKISVWRPIPNEKPTSQKFHSPIVAKE
ncbi:hypothetical protein LSS_00055 [Leptospira santarosai serovar Shermani str. LT 821]|uniref:Uncharacterized protein n=1 Tax=Leptospira santarosai serovar Shermani str. LT 821 TaxID=758847 RepID=K8YEI4_9LEPT|nr:hypothetical protein LSS_00055 [Leptospira santarosai serovar Shermani str. LT 821]